MHCLKCGAFFFVGIEMIRTAKDGGDEVVLQVAKLPFSENFFSPSVSLTADSSLVTPARRRAYKAQPSAAWLLARRRGSLLMLP